MKRGIRIVRGMIVVLSAIFWALLLFFPAPHAFAAGDERYLCAWSDGSLTEESYSGAMLALQWLESDVVVLSRDGRTGRVAAGEECRAAYSVFQSGDLGELFAFDISGVTRLERAALYRRFHDRLWYAGEYFTWTGSGMERTQAHETEEFVLLYGSIAAARLQETAAKTLYLRAEAEFGAATLMGTQVERAVAEAPYVSAGNTVCLSTPGGVRLVAGLPAAHSVTVPADVYFADEGALLPCAALGEAAVPFVGSSVNSAGSAYRGEFAYLFSTGKEYRVPETLKTVRVTGGSLVSHAFYGCGSIEEIDACGVSAQNIHRDAFSDCVSLKLLHTPRADVTLQGNFTKRAAPCGCTIYERAD